MHSNGQANLFTLNWFSLGSMTLENLDTDAYTYVYLKYLRYIPKRYNCIYLRICARVTYPTSGHFCHQMSLVQPRHAQVLHFAARDLRQDLHSAGAASEADLNHTTTVGHLTQ